MQETIDHCHRPPLCSTAKPPGLKVLGMFQPDWAPIVHTANYPAERLPSQASLEVNYILYILSFEEYLDTTFWKTKTLKKRKQRRGYQDPSDQALPAEPSSVAKGRQAKKWAKAPKLKVEMKITGRLSGDAPVFKTDVISSAGNAASALSLSPKK